MRANANRQLCHVKPPRLLPPPSIPTTIPAHSPTRPTVPSFRRWQPQIVPRSDGTDGRCGDRFHGRSYYWPRLDRHVLRKRHRFRSRKRLQSRNTLQLRKRTPVGRVRGRFSSCPVRQEKKLCPQFANGTLPAIWNMIPTMFQIPRKPIKRICRRHLHSR